MKTDHAEYNVKDSVDRINQIVTAQDSNYEERDRIPARNELTYINGFYVKCSALCVDIRKSPELTNFHTNIADIKLYRVFISEVTAVMNGNPKCAEINIADGSVWGVFDTPFQEDVDEVFSTAARISSLIDIMNYKLKKNNLKEIAIGVGMSYGKALAVKTGYRGSGVGEVIWMGNVIEEASKLASYGNKESTDKETMISEITYYNLNEKNREILSYNPTRNCYHGDIINTYMETWYKQHNP
ncbi:MAG: adenylate/guanylate cyclase domain-containing protein [Candidatus Bathyarchaeia archaeon]|jgi:class 3 adenylate cyclase